MEGPHLAIMGQVKEGERLGGDADGDKKGKERKGGMKCFRLLYGGYFGVCSLFPFGVLILCRQCPPAPPTQRFSEKSKTRTRTKKTNLSVHDPSGKRRQDYFLFLWTASHFGSI